MILRSRLVHVGSSSLASEMVVTDAEYGEVLVQARRSFALMSTVTGRSEKLPDEIRYEYQQMFG